MICEYHNHPKEQGNIKKVAYNSFVQNIIVEQFLLFNVIM